MADNGLDGMPQFDHSEDETITVSPICASAAVGYGMAEYVTEEKKPRKQGRSGPRAKSQNNPAQTDKENSES